MRRIIASFLSLFAGILCAAEAGHGEGTCWVLGVAFDPDLKNTEAWNTFGEQFTTAFTDNAATIFKAVRTKNVLGREASKLNILGGLNSIASSAGPKDFVACYIGSPANVDPHEGWDLTAMNSHVVTGKEIKAIVSKLPCPVLLVIDTSSAGAFVTNAKDIPVPPNCTVICANSARKVGSNHLSTALQEGLWGRADSDCDGVVDLDELSNYIRERVSEQTDKNLLPRQQKLDQAVISKGATVPPELKLVKTSNALVAIARQNEWHLGRLVKEDKGKCKVHVMGYSDDPRSEFFLLNETAKENVFNVDHSNPQPAYVIEGERRRLALLLSTEGGKFKVQYPLPAPSTEGFVTKKELVMPFGGEDGEGEKKKRKRKKDK